MKKRKTLIFSFALLILLILIVLGSAIAGCARQKKDASAGQGAQATTAPAFSGAITEDFAAAMAKTFVTRDPEYANFSGRNPEVIFASEAECRECFVVVVTFFRTRNNTDERVTMLVHTEANRITGHEITRIEAFSEGARPAQVPAPQNVQEPKQVPQKKIVTPGENDAETMLRKHLDEEGISFSDIKLQRSIEWSAAGITEKLFSVKTEDGFIGALLVLRNDALQSIDLVSKDDDPAMISCFEQMGRYVQRFGEDTCVYDNGFACRDSDFEAGKC
ncbi:hypothetical protein D6764_04810 [Candidatus Woesearchaeota archaeon]|nr:MAG: hypothetical protein D6764_04810 [Candidatus Woesearchaeota archaeon]